MADLNRRILMTLLFSIRVFGGKVRRDSSGNRAGFRHECLIHSVAAMGSRTAFVGQASTVAAPGWVFRNDGKARRLKTVGYQGRNALFLK